MPYAFGPKYLERMMQTRASFSASIPRRHNPEIFMHVAAVVTKSGYVLATGYNYCPASIPITMHAERDALDKAVNAVHRKYGRGKFKKAMNVDLVVVRHNGLNSRPCYNCITEAITYNNYFNIDSVIYSNNEAPGGMVYTNPNKLYKARWEHVSRFNARRMNLFDNDAVVEPCLDADCEDCDHHHHHHMEIETNDEDDTEGKARIYP